MKYKRQTHYICVPPQVLGGKGSSAPLTCACFCYATEYDVCEALTHEHPETIQGTSTTANTGTHITEDKHNSSAHSALCGGI